MHVFLWLIDKISDILLPGVFAKAKIIFLKRPLQTFAITATGTIVLFIGGFIFDTLPYHPIAFLGDDKPLRLTNYLSAKGLRHRVEDYLLAQADILFSDSDDTENHSWSYANILMGLGPDVVASKFKRDHFSFFHRQMRPGKNCWPQFRNTSRIEPCHTGATSWVLAALASNGVQPSRKMWTYLLDQQSLIGWWPLYEDSAIDPQNASTYSTAIALWSIQTGLTKNAIQSDLRDRAQASAQRAKSWLMSNREGSCAWLEYPDRSVKKEPSVAISGLVIYVLKEMDPRLLESSQEDCITYFTKNKLVITDLEISGEVVEMNDGTDFLDAVKHQKLVWSTLALAKLYPDLSWVSKARLRKYIESTLFASPTPESALNYPWQMGEFAFMLKSIY